MLTGTLLAGLVPATWAAEPAAAGPSWLSSLDAGRRQAQATGKPLLIRAVADWCPACRLLTAEFAKPDVRRELENWTLVEIDVDRAPEEARALNVTAVPALRLQTNRGQRVAARDGALTSAELLAWLAGHREAARVGPDDVLLQSGTPDLVAVIRIIRQFGDRDPAVRQAAVGRLAPHPAVAGTAVLKALREGSLAARLSALELFERWQAPLAGLDPWQPETLTAERLASIERWLEQLPETPSAKPSAGVGEPAPSRALSPAELADARQQFDRLRRASDTEADAIRDQLARFGEGLRDELYRRLQEAETDRDRERLRALRYRLVATDLLVLRWPGGLSRLAATDAGERRRAADDLAKLVTPDEQPLLLELFSDPDPLVREIGLRALKESGGPQASAALVKLLKDPELNVRAAVLKQLEEEPLSDLVPPVAEYLKTEKNADLIVHAIRFLQAAGGRTARRTLMGLLKHASWQVRAEAAAGLGKAGSPTARHFSDPFAEDRNVSTEEKVTVYVALLELLDDADAFVVSRAVEGLSGADLEAAAEPLAKAALRHPDLAKPIVGLLASGQTLSKKALPHLRKFAKDNDPAVRAAAVEGLAKLAPADLEAILLAALADREASVRIAAAEAIFVAATQTGRERLQQLQTGSPSAKTPAVPFLQTLADAIKGPATAAKEPQDSAWDQWLRRLYGGMGRPAWAEATIPTLQKMLPATQADERVAAACALVPLGRAEQAVPVILDAVKADPKLFHEAHSILPWLVSAERQRVLQQLRPFAQTNERFAEMLKSFTEVAEAGQAETLWNLLAEQKAPGPAIATVISGMSKIYFGERWYGDTEKLTASQRRAVEQAVKPRLVTGTEWQRVAALVLLLNIAPADVVEPAARMADDQRLDAAVREVAFQIQLAGQSPKERKATAIGAFNQADPWRRSLALRYLVQGEDALRYGTRPEAGWAVHLNLPPTADEPFGRSPSGGQMIVPKPPAGLKAEQLAPLLADGDPKVAAYAAYLLTLFGDPAGLPPLLRYWRSNKEDRDECDKLVYRAIAALNDTTQLNVLREIYSRLHEYEVEEFYWTIRIIEGPEILPFRKQIRADMQRNKT